MSYLQAGCIAAPLDHHPSIHLFNPHFLTYLASAASLSYFSQTVCVFFPFESLVFARIDGKLTLLWLLVRLGKPVC